jgi:UDP-N-acetylmuramate--alanine ligase
VDDFAVSLSKFDEILLMEIYPAREEPVPGVNSTWLLEKINNPNKRLVSKSGLIDEIKKYRTGVLVAIGAGDIGLEVSKIKKELTYAS